MNQYERFVFWERNLDYEISLQVDAHDIAKGGHFQILCGMCGLHLSDYLATLVN